MEKSALPFLRNTIRSVYNSKYFHPNLNNNYTCSIFLKESIINYFKMIWKSNLRSNIKDTDDEDVNPIQKFEDRQLGIMGMGNSDDMAKYQKELLDFR